MSLAAANVEVIILNGSDVEVGRGRTDISGNLDFPLPPGKYKMQIGTLSGYTYEKTTLTEPGSAAIISAVNPVLDVDVIENASTTAVTNFIQN